MSDDANEREHVRRLGGPIAGEAGDAASRRVLELLAGKWLTAAICAAATLGIPEALEEEPKSCEALARAIGCEPSALARLLRVLAGESLVCEGADGRFELLPAGRLLRQDALGRLARYVGSPLGWDAWSDLVHSVRTGESAFAKRYGRPLFDHLDRHPDQAALYDAAIEAFAQREAVALAERFDFSDVRRVLDVGGGRGGLLVELLGRHPHLSGLLLERPTAVREARAAFARAGLAGRCEAVVGDFFEALPEGADLCIVKHIVHSWDDDTASALLARCARAVGPDGRVLVIEGILMRDGRRNLTNMLDLEMLVLCGPGRERTKPELRRLFARAGLSLVESRPLTESARLFVTRPRATARRPRA
ncbi:MAG: methyltransferase [Myxococcota bacterium]